MGRLAFLLTDHGELACHGPLDGVRRAAVGGAVAHVGSFSFLRSLFSGHRTHQTAFLTTALPNPATSTFALLHTPKSGSSGDFAGDHLSCTASETAVTSSFVGGGKAPVAFGGSSGITESTRDGKPSSFVDGEKIEDVMVPMKQFFNRGRPTTDWASNLLLTLTAQLKMVGTQADVIQAGVKNYQKADQKAREIKLNMQNMHKVFNDLQEGLGHVQKKLERFRKEIYISNMQEEERQKQKAHESIQVHSTQG